MSLERDALVKFEEIEKRIHSLNKKTVGNSTNLDEMNAKMLSINEGLNETTTELLNLKDFIENTETFNTYDLKCFDHGKKGIGTGLSFDKINFLCKKNTLVKIKLKVNAYYHSAGSTYTGNFYTMLNKSAISSPIYRESITFNDYKEVSFEVDYSFYPSQEANFLFIRLTSTSSSASTKIGITSVNLEITGRNIVLLQRNIDFKVYISKDHYYITKNTAEGGLYLKAPTSNVDLSSFTTIPTLVPQSNSSYNETFYPFNHTFLPKFYYDVETNKYSIDDSVDFFVFCVNPSGIISSGPGDPVPTATLSNWSLRGWIYTVGHPGNNGATSRFISFVYSSNSAGLYYPGFSLGEDGSLSHTQLTLNGVKVAGVWVSNTAVFAKDWEDNPNNPFMCVATNDMAQNIFFPALSSTYTVDLGRGYQTNAYLQFDGTITVYLTWRNTVYKKTLIFNSSTEKYELSPIVVEYPETSEILEGYSTDKFIRDINGNWSYQPPEEE